MITATPSEGAPRHSDMNKNSVIWKRQKSRIAAVTQSAVNRIFFTRHRSRRWMHSSAAAAGQANSARAMNSWSHPEVRYNGPVHVLFKSSLSLVWRVPNTQTTYLHSACGRCGPMNSTSQEVSVVFSTSSKCQNYHNVRKQCCASFNSATRWWNEADNGAKDAIDRRLNDRLTSGHWAGE